MESFLNQTVPLLVVGVLGGISNAVAGGASLMSMPCLLAVGLPLPAALATNKLATSGQTFFTAFQFSQRNKFDVDVWKRSVIPCFAGAIVGANLVLKLPPIVLKVVVGLVLLMALFLILRGQPMPPSNKVAISQSSAPSVLTRFLILCGLGGYGGFFGGGVGLVLVPALHRLFGLDFLRANAVKAGLASVMNGVALSIFLFHDFVSFPDGDTAEPLVRWIPGGILLVGMLIGSWVGVKLAIHRGESFVKKGLIVATLASLVLLAVR